MPRSSTTRLAAALAALTSVALLPAAAEAARATFAVEVEAHRTVTWDHPRVEFGGDCKGKRYQEGHGSEDFKLWSGDTGRLVVEGTRKRLTYHEFGTEGKGRTLDPTEPPTAKSVITRQRHWTTGTTGGWCGGGRPDEPQENDCGTKLAPFTYRLQLYKDELGFRETRGSAPREKYDFYQCSLITPAGVPVGSFPHLDKPLPLAQLFSRERTITIEGKQDYGPSRTPLGNGSFRTASAAYTWTMTLTRVRNLQPRSSNG